MAGRDFLMWTAPVVAFCFTKQLYHVPLRSYHHQRHRPPTERGDLDRVKGFERS